MGAAAAAAAAAKADCRASGGKPSARAQRHALGAMYWRPWRDLPARHSPWRTVASRLPLEPRGRVGTRARGAAGTSRCRWHIRLGAPQHRQHACARPTACRRRQKEGPTDEALRRSRGGFSTKVPLCAEGGGKPLAMECTAGECHETRGFAALMAQRAVARVGRTGAAAPTAADHSLQAVAADCHPLQEACVLLRGGVATRRNLAMAILCKHALARNDLNTPPCSVPTHAFRPSLI